MCRIDGGIELDEGGDGFLDEECEQMALDGRNLNAGHEIKTISAVRPDLPRLPGPPYVVVIGDSDDIEIRLLFHVVQDL